MKAYFASLSQPLQNCLFFYFLDHFFVHRAKFEDDWRQLQRLRFQDHGPCICNHSYFNCTVHLTFSQVRNVRQQLGLSPFCRMLSTTETILLGSVRISNTFGPSSATRMKISICTRYYFLSACYVPALTLCTKSHWREYIVIFLKIRHFKSQQSMTCRQEWSTSYSKDVAKRIWHPWPFCTKIRLLYSCEPKQQKMESVGGWSLTCRVGEWYSIMPSLRNLVGLMSVKAVFLSF